MTKLTDGDCEKQRDEYQSLLIKCYKYMTGMKPGPDAVTLKRELYETMEKIGIVGTGSSATTKDK